MNQRTRMIATTTTMLPITMLTCSPNGLALFATRTAYDHSCGF
jgi:hypothetical protein